MLRLTFQVDMIDRPWDGGDHHYVTYDEEDTRFISEAIRMMMAGETNNILVPLKLTVNGMRYYMCITRVDRNFRFTQVRGEFSMDGSRSTFIVRERPVRLLGPGLLAEVRHLTFDSASVDRVMFKTVFWDILNGHWAKTINTISLTTNQHMPTNTLLFAHDSRAGGGWAQFPAPVPLRDHSPYNGGMMANIEIGFLAICLPESGPTSQMMIPSFDTDSHYVAIRRTGNVLTVSDFHYRQFGDVIESVFIFPDEMRTSFPGFQFVSAKLTDAERQAMVQKPVFDHYTQMFEPYVTHYRYNARMALLSCLHPRVAGRVKLSILGADLINALAKMIL